MKMFKHDRVYFIRELRRIIQDSQFMRLIPYVTCVYRAFIRLTKGGVK